MTCLFGLRFWLAGAWPVMIFSLLDIPLVVLLLVLNFRGARASETVLLTDNALTVIRTDAAGRSETLSLPSAWLRVDLHDRTQVPHIIVHGHGRSLEIGAFLHEPGKIALYEALRDAVHSLKNPVFDNPQLREE